jgi:hypothetical protein
VVSPVHQDPFWDNLLKPVVSLAESIPLRAIARRLERHDT